MIICAHMQFLPVFKFIGTRKNNGRNYYGLSKDLIYKIFDEFLCNSEGTKVFFFVVVVVVVAI